MRAGFGRIRGRFPVVVERGFCVRPGYGAAALLSSVLAVACESPVAPVACGPLPQVTVNVGEISNVAACFNDANGDVLTYTATSSNPRIATTFLAGTTITVTAVAPGNTTVIVATRDPGGLQGQSSFAVMVPNRAPQPRGTMSSVSVRAGQTVTVDASQHFSEPDGEALTYAAGSSDADVASVRVAGSTITATAEAKGGATIAITASDPGGLSAIQSFRLTVPNRSPMPVGAIDARTIEEGQSVTLDIAGSFADPDGDVLTYATASLIAAVAGASVSGSAVTITARGPGTTTVTITARDDEQATATQQVSVTVPQPNRAPRPVGSIPPHEIRTGETATVDASTYFTDPDGDPLAYSASSSDIGIASVQVFGATLELTGVRKGVVDITVTAADQDGLAATQSFQMTVSEEEEPPGSFHIELRFATEMSETQRAAFESASARWMAILGDTELPDMPVPEGVVRCRFPSRTYEQNARVVDDLLIIAAVAEIDGVGETLGRAAFCSLREASQLPWLGAMEFDAADLDRMEENGTLESVILHEMGHVLGIGTLWGYHGLLRNPSLAAEREVDTHFAGAKAIRAFDEVGGASYTGGAKVPVENRGTRSGSDDSHWRKRVFGDELMSPSIAPGSSPLSAVTIASLADLGYAVSMDLADAYRFPGVAALRAHQRRAIDLGNDVIRGPVEVRDKDGRVVRTIRP